MPNQLTPIQDYLYHETELNRGVRTSFSLIFYLDQNQEEKQANLFTGLSISNISWGYTNNDTIDILVAITTPFISKISARKIIYF